MRCRNRAVRPAVPRPSSLVSHVRNRSPCLPAVSLACGATRAYAHAHASAALLSATPALHTCQQSQLLPSRLLDSPPQPSLHPPSLHETPRCGLPLPAWRRAARVAPARGPPSSRSLERKRMRDARSDCRVAASACNFAKAMPARAGRASPREARRWAPPAARSAHRCYVAKSLQRQTGGLRDNRRVGLVGLPSLMRWALIRPTPSVARDPTRPP